jgi:uridine phosphorylase
MNNKMLYHIGFSKADLGECPPEIALLSGDPQRANFIAKTHLQNVQLLSENRGLHSYLGDLPNGKKILSATSAKRRK